MFLVELFSIPLIDTSREEITIYLHRITKILDLISVPPCMWMNNNKHPAQHNRWGGGHEEGHWLCRSNPVVRLKSLTYFHKWPEAERKVENHMIWFKGKLMRNVKAGGGKKNPKCRHSIFFMCQDVLLCWPNSSTENIFYINMNDCNP